MMMINTVLNSVSIAIVFYCNKGKSLMIYNPPLLNTVCSQWLSMNGISSIVILNTCCICLRKEIFFLVAIMTTHLHRTFMPRMLGAYLHFLPCLHFVVLQGYTCDIRQLVVSL